MSKPRPIDKWYNMFRQYPEVFPDAYFRFLKANLEDSYNHNSFIDAGTVLLTWKQYKKGNDYAKPGDFALEKMVSVKPGDGKAQKVMTRFLKKIPKGTTCYLKVAKHNTRAICFYERNGFKTCKHIYFGETLPGLLMRRI